MKQDFNYQMNGYHKREMNLQLIQLQLQMVKYSTYQYLRIALPFQSQYNTYHYNKSE